MFKKVLSLALILCFFLTSLGPMPQAHADAILNLPAPGAMVSVSPSFEPALIKGLTVHKDNPFLFDFIVDPGNEYRHPEQSEGSQQEQLKEESDRMIKYFFASLTIPDNDVWVNLSPYEKDRMIPQTLGETAMGRDLLAQDYLLKQLTASLIYPQAALGKTFWTRVYAKAKAMYGTTQVPVNTFNKVWIMPQRVGIYEHGQTAYIVNAHLKVMLEEDYLALNRHSEGVRSTTEESKGALRSFAGAQDDRSHLVASQIIRAIILPEIEKEVNEDKNFSTLRQIFYAQALAVWFKRNLKQALLNRVYANKGIVKGIERQVVIPAKAGIQNQDVSPERIYQQYLKAYKKGVFNYIQEDIDPATQETLPRKYFSGGYSGDISLTPAMISVAQLGQVAARGVDFAVLAATPQVAAVLAKNVAKANAAMIGATTFKTGNPLKGKKILYSSNGIILSQEDDKTYLTINDKRVIVQGKVPSEIQDINIRPLVEHSSVEHSSLENIAVLSGSDKNTFAFVNLFNGKSSGVIKSPHGLTDYVISNIGDGVLLISKDKMLVINMEKGTSSSSWLDVSPASRPPYALRLTHDRKMAMIRNSNEILVVNIATGANTGWVINTKGSELYGEASSPNGEAVLLQTDSRLAVMLVGKKQSSFNWFNLPSGAQSYIKHIILTVDDRIAALQNNHGQVQVVSVIDENKNLWATPEISLLTPNEFIASIKVSSNKKNVVILSYDDGDIARISRSGVNYIHNTLKANAKEIIAISPSGQYAIIEDRRGQFQRIDFTNKKVDLIKKTHRGKILSAEVRDNGNVYLAYTDKVTEEFPSIQPEPDAAMMTENERLEAANKTIAEVHNNLITFKLLSHLYKIMADSDNAYPVNIKEQRIEEILGPVSLDIYSHKDGKAQIKFANDTGKKSRLHQFSRVSFVELFADLLRKDSILAEQLFRQLADQVTSRAMNADKAKLTNKPTVEGGIDLSQEDSAIHVSKDANGGVRVDVDPALIARIEREGMPEVDPVIIGMRPADIHSLFGVGVSVSTP